MKLFRIILVLSSLLILTNCAGVHPQKIDISKIKKDRKLPEPNFFIPDAQYKTTGQGSSWNLRQFMDFRFWSPPFFNSKEQKQHKAAVYMALNHVKNLEVVSWYSKSRDAGGKIRPIFTYGINSSTCRDFQVLLYIEKKARSKTFTGCKFVWGYWNFNYWDWPGAEKYIN
ncbi:MAG: hypothetical protein ISQ17_04550 [Pelagibacteraceae bacterium]|nr:hypothetical protein [Pelagibacteraceae bacterium]